MLKYIRELVGISELDMINFDPQFFNVISPAIAVWLTVAVIFIVLVVVRGR